MPKLPFNNSIFLFSFALFTCWPVSLVTHCTEQLMARIQRYRFKDADVKDSDEKDTDEKNTDA
jgi:hypothetical protein